MSTTDSIRTEIIMRSAERRLDLALREFKRQVFGDEHYLEELAESDRINREIRAQPPAPPEVRQRLKRWWGWTKRGR